MNFPSISEISNKAQNTLKRFPITLLWAIVGSIYTIYLVEYSDYNNRDENAIVILTFILGVSWLIGAQFLSEQLKNAIQGLLIKCGLLVLLFLFYWHIPKPDGFDGNPKYIMRFFLFLISGHLFVLFAPFLFSWKKEPYWNYLKSVAFALLRSAFFSGVLYLGLVLALLAINALFEANIHDDIYLQLFIFCLGIINTWIYLSDFPNAIHQQQEIHFNKALEVFVKYILIPLVLLYLIILYAYGFKILIEWELPKGWVSYLVTALAILGFTVQVIINPVQRTIKSWAIGNFHPWFYRLLLPLVLLLFVAIFRRINDYGITENRYFVVVLALWISGITLYLLLSKKKSLTILPLSLFVLSILSSFGFWGALSVSYKSQVSQFVTIFETIKKNENQATSGEYNQMLSILEYLDDRHLVHKLDTTTGIQIKEVFRDTIIDSKSGNYTWFDSRKVLDSLGVKMVMTPSEERIDNSYFNFYTNQSKSYTYDLEGFETMTNFTLYGKEENGLKINELLLQFDSETVELELLRQSDSVELGAIPLKEHLLNLRKNDSYDHQMEPEHMTFNFTNDNVSARVIFSNIGFYMEKDSLDMYHSTGIIFLKQKQNVE